MFYLILSIQNFIYKTLDLLFWRTKYKPEKKKGIKGILYLTKAPKFVPAIPTPKAKNKEKIKK